MNIKITTKTMTIDLDDPENIEIKKAKERADGIMEWAKMFWQAHLLFLIVSVILAFTPSNRAFWVALAMTYLCFGMRYMLQLIAKNHLMNAIKRNMPRE